MRRRQANVVVLVLLAACNRQDSQHQGLAPSPGVDRRPAGTQVTLTEARRAFQTQVVRKQKGNTPAAEPPPRAFRVVHYESPTGKLAAYLTPNPGDGKHHPAIIWITGGDCNSIDDVWKEARPSNDQTARAFREAGVIMMFP